jgi:ubiquinone/menaquinone biosynthesis C-methylase UbiE
MANVGADQRPQLSPQQSECTTVRNYYDHVYYAGATASRGIPEHYTRLARRFQPWRGKNLLDVACGSGVWLRAAAKFGALPAGVDISQVALDVCRDVLPQADLHCGPAEKLSFPDQRFDFVSCLGALEHFIDPQSALREMIRVAKPNAKFLLLVPNSEFLPMRLGLYAGTHQASVREEARTLEGWQELFESVGLCVDKRWRDLHVLSPRWVTRGPWYFWPVRLAQALMLTIWPLRWQYQVYHLCQLAK